VEWHQGNHLDKQSWACHRGRAVGSVDVLGVLRPPMRPSTSVRLSQYILSTTHRCGDVTTLFLCFGSTVVCLKRAATQRRTVKRTRQKFLLRNSRQNRKENRKSKRVQLVIFLLTFKSLSVFSPTYLIFLMIKLQICTQGTLNKF